MEVLNLVFFNNKLSELLIVAVWMMTGYLFHLFFTKSIIKIVVRAFNYTSKADDSKAFHKKLKSPLRAIIFLLFIYLATNKLHWPFDIDYQLFGKSLHTVLRKSYDISIIVTAAFFLIRLADCFRIILIDKAKQTTSKQDDQLVPFLTEIIKIIIWIITLLIILSVVFKLDISSLVAGLGIGGLAIALAAQDTLANLFGSFTIFFDRPFVVGDLVKVHGITGVIEQVGFRSTRIRTLEKSYVTLPNKKMIDAELDNLTLRTSRRIDFSIGLTYSSTAEQTQKIVSQIKEVIKNHPRITEDFQVRFTGFGASSLDIKILYYVNTMEWDTTLTVKEEINYKIMEIVEQNNSSFAFPSRTVYLEK